MLKKRLLAAEDFQEKASVDNSPGKENLITLPVLSFTYYNGVQPFRRQMEHFFTDMSNRVEHQK